ncbi:glycosyl transferases group 1 family protein [Paraburkholderia xenovorans LB400]|uniref:Glycosyl transferase, group 1 family n=1 Tax=Paraburkholderia xenovorans (strain LB400) TaxID=266265 RepID=Q13YM2_PARXL|nr:glycosyltransferase family 4 protein [Paraburkholderia xenovorans]ABE30817.1 Putative glycosyl transferase, group 1 family [Paraburkholderia xenovorans LB400]AIP33206.1 glycosyl transferases group 1 family protein [Paraburkholderia xenovorans LB400]NPT34304.1 glycosyltransferase [Paraburkholderia xenovorans]
MKALSVLHSESSRGWGGQEVRTLKEMIALRALGHNVELVCPEDARLGIRSRAEGFAVHHARMRTGGDLRSMLTIRTLLERGRFNVLNTHSGHDSLVAGMAGRLARTPFIVRTRHLALPITSLATYNWIPHRVVAVSHHVRRYLISAGVQESRVETIYDGIVKPEALTHSTLRDELGLNAGAIVAGMVAIVREKKGHEDLIAAVRPMLAERPDLHVVMAGDGVWFGKIRAIVDGMGLAHRIHLLGFRTDITNVLRGCDLFVLPTHQEALGQSFIEAMAAGLPVIGTRVDGVPELIDDGVNGLLVPAHDIEALRAALARLIDDAPLRARLGLAARLKTDSRFTVDAMANETVDCYMRGIVGRRPYYGQWRATA